MLYRFYMAHLARFVILAKNEIFFLLLDYAVLSHNDEAASSVVDCRPSPALTVKVRQYDGIFIDDLTRLSLNN